MRSARPFVAALLLASPALAGAQGAPPPVTGTLPFTLFGEVRTRTEYDRPADAAEPDAFTYLRSRVGVRVDPAPGARIVLQVQDSRVLGAETSTSASALAADVLDLHQGYLELAMPALGAAVRAGRQEIALGNERLVGAVNWSNSGRSFDGARVTLAPRDTAARWTATGFAAVIDERGRHFGPGSAGARDHLLAGAYAASDARRGAVLDATLLYDANARYRTFEAATRTTLDVRLRMARVADALPLRVELEGAVQGGHQRLVPAAPVPDSAQSVRAWLAGVRVGTPLRAGAASVTAGADLLSGDAASGDGRYTAFSTLYATNHPFYGLMDLIGDPATTTRDRGLLDLFLTGAIPLSPSSALRAELHHFALATGGDRPLGTEGDLLLPVRLSAAASADLGYALFRGERGGAQVGLPSEGARQHWAFLQLAVSF